MSATSPVATGELAVLGTPAAAAPVNYPAGRHWIGNATFQPITIATALPSTAPLWFFDASSQSWRNRFVGDLTSASNAPTRLEPGQAIFANHTAPFTLAHADPTLEIRYYHQDHLGSSSVMTDATGQLVSESTFYPFGHPRNEHEPRNVKESYGFTQKERDGESGLNYFEARFLHSAASRFASVDPAYGEFDVEKKSSPQSLNNYSYVSNGPPNNVDPDGRELVKYTAPKSTYITGQRTMFIDAKAVNKIASLLEFAVENKIKVNINSSFRSSDKQGSAAIQSGGTTPAKKGTSAHEGGTAFDFNLYKKTGGMIAGNKGVTSKHPFIVKAKELGFRWGGEFKKKDAIHCDLGTKDRSAQITENQKHMGELSDPKKEWASITINSPDSSSETLFFEPTVITAPVKNK